MLIAGQRRSSQIATCLDAAGDYHLNPTQAIAIVSQQLDTIGAHWMNLCEEAGLGQIDRRLIWGRQFLNPFAFYGLEGAAARLRAEADAVRASAS